MLSPEPMRHLALAVLATDLEAASRAIAGIGVLHLLDVRHLAGREAAIQPYDVREEVGGLERISSTLDDVAQVLGLAAPDPEAVGSVGKVADLHAVELRVKEIAGEVESLRQRMQQAGEEDQRRANLLQTLQALAPLGFRLEDLRRLRYVHLSSGMLPARNLPRLRESLERIVSMILPADEIGPDGRVLVTALCLQRDREVLERALRSAQFEPLQLPARLSGTPEEGIAQVAAQRAAHGREMAALEQERERLARRLVPELQLLRVSMARERLLVQARGLMGHSDRTALISGWVPAVLADPLEQAIHKAVGNRCVTQWTSPGEMEGVRGGGIPVPILLHNPVLIRPFERLLRAYGLPRYGEVEPTAVVALGFLTMFGFMFGDVGHGVVLFGIGYFIYRRMFRYRDYAVILMECGVFAAVFGFLYGSIFGVERWLPALWLRPMDDMATLMTTAILFGIGFLSVGISLNVFNAVRRRDLAALGERNGLLGALAYWIAVGLFVRRLTAGPGAVTLGTGLLWLAVPLALIFLKEPFLVVVKGVRARQWPEASEVFALIVQSVVEVLDTIVSAISNTATFIRLAAFALSHAGLFLATFSVADAVSRTGGGTVGAAVVLVVGNAVIIALEGLIVAIQSIRLEYYEFFSKFYSGGGEEYRPLRIASSLTHP